MGDRTIALSLKVDLDQSRLMENVMSAHMDGITNPPIDELLDKQLGEGLLEYVGPLVDTHVHEKPLSIALREINEGLLSIENLEPTA
ncbi:MAG: hypothetical protein RL560_420 [Actinomycetota bacterium]